MYEKDKRFRITLRLNEEQFNFVSSTAGVLGVSPSDFLRMVVNSTMVGAKKIDERVEQGIAGTVNTVKEGSGRANDETDKYHIV